MKWETFTKDGYKLTVTRRLGRWWAFSVTKGDSWIGGGIASRKSPGKSQRSHAKELGWIQIKEDRKKSMSV